MNPDQTAQEQSDLCPHCLSKSYLTFQQTIKEDDFYCDWPFKGLMENYLVHLNHSVHMRYIIVICWCVTVSMTR